MAWTSQFTFAFTGTQYTALPSVNATWVNDHGTNRIGTGGATAGSAGESRSHITTTLADKQAVQIKILDSNAAGQGVTLRANAGSASYWGWTGYLFVWENDATVKIYRSNNGSGTSLGSYSQTLSSGDVLRGEADGSTIRLLVNGTERISVTDATYSSGYAGLFSGGTLDAWGDDFAAEDDSGAAGRSTKNTRSHALGIGLGLARTVPR